MKTILAAMIVLAAALAASAQKAEPNRITFAKGKSAATLTATLSNGEEMDYVFGARAGQTVTMSVRSEPSGDLFDFSVAGDGFEFATEQESYTEYEFTTPETGDYLVTVRKRPGDGPRRAKFFFKLSIR